MTAKNVVPLDAEKLHELKAERDAFSIVWARYQFLQRELAKPGPDEKEDDDKRLDDLMDQSSVALWELIRTRAVQPYQVDFKLQVLRELIEDSSWLDGRDKFLLESIRMDIA
jgi:hypothetical protein